MTVIQYPSPLPPTTQFIAEIAARTTATYRQWCAECHMSDEGQPFLTLEHRYRGTVLGVHWKDGGWAILNERGEVQSEGRDVWTLVQLTLR